MHDAVLSTEDVAARFRWARRRGHPAWLWPDIEVATWQCALTAMEGSTRALLTGARVATLAGDPRAIGLAGYTSGVGPLLGYWHAQHQLACSPMIGAELARQFDHNQRRTDRMVNIAAVLVTALAADGIAAVVLKGAHTAGTYFPHPATRPVSDIDLLIDPVVARNAERVLGQLGFVETSRAARESSWRLAGAPEAPRTLTFVHADDPWTIDLHVSLDIALGAGAPVARFDRAAPFAGSARWPVAPVAHALEQPLLALHIAAHAGSGLHNLTLLRLVELHLVLRRDTARGMLDWQAFIDTGARIGALGFAWPTLQLCERLVPGTIPGAVLDRCAAATPPAVRRIVDRLTPATAQRLHGGSLAQHFMWTRGARGWLDKLAGDLLPATGSARQTLAIYERRAWQMLRGHFSR
jgi:hypothetical protein